MNFILKKNLIQMLLMLKNLNKKLRKLRVKLQLSRFNFKN